MSDEPEKTVAHAELLRMTTDIVSAFLDGNSLGQEGVSPLIYGTYAALEKDQGTITLCNAKPAISVRRSVTPDFLICLEDGRKLKMLKRYLRTSYGLSPEDYRAKWNLPSDYPMVAPNYAKRRSEFAKKIGLGRKPS